jgi:hypothetical protein
VEAAYQPIFEAGNLSGRRIRSQDDLFLLLVEGVEGVEKLLLAALSVGEELDVVDNQYIDVPVSVAEVV